MVVVWGGGGGMEVKWGGGSIGWWWWDGVVGLWRNGLAGGGREIGWETLMIVVLPQGCHYQLVKTSPPF